MTKRLSLIFLVSGMALASVDQGWQQLAANDFAGARTSFAETKDSETLAEIGWFLTFSGNGPTPELESAALTILQRDASSGASEFVLKWMDSFNECLPDWGDKAGKLLSTVKATNPELLVFIANNLRLYARQFNETPAFEKLAQDAGFLTRWKVSPRFGFHPIAAYEQAWPADKASFWKDQGVPHLCRTGVVVPPMEAQGRGVYYAFGSFENPTKQEVLLRVFSYQNISVYVDGLQWANLKHLETLEPNVTYLKGELPKGEHEIVVKTTQSKGNSGQFSIQLSAALPIGLGMPETAQHDLAGNASGVVQTEAGLLAELKDQPGELAAFIRAMLHLRYKDQQRAIEILEPMATTYGESKLIGGALARVYISDINFLSPEITLGRAYQYLSQLAMLSRDNNLENLLTLSLLLSKAKQSKQSLELVSGIVEANPNFCDALDARGLFARQEGLSDIVRQNQDLLEKMGPENRWSQIKLLEEARRVSDLEQTRALLTNLGSLLPWEGYQAQLYEMDENYPAAIEDLLKRWAVFDDRDFYPISIAQAYAKLGDHAAEREWYEKTLAVNPGNREAILALVNLDCLEGKIEQTRTRLESYLKLEPADAFFRQRLSHLEGKTAFEGFRVEANTVINKAKNKPMTAGADSELLLDQMMVRLFRDGSQMRYTHLVTRVLTKKGVDEEAELNLAPSLEILELRTIKSDGSVFYPANIDHKSSISLSGLGVGDFIDEEHIEYIGPAYYDADGLNAEMTFIFQGVDRVYHHSELVLIYPADLKPEPVLISKNFPGEPEIQEKDGMKTVRWLTENQPPLAVEPAMPNRAYSQATASFCYNTSWQEVHDFYYDAIRNRMGLSDNVLNQVASWRKEKSDPLELAQYVYEQVVDRVETDGNFFDNINLTWETSKGNPTLLLDAIYEALGLDADLVFVEPLEMKLYSLETPMPIYNYALLRLKIGDTIYWADPNQRGVPFNYIPFPYRNTQGMVMSMTGDLFTTTPDGDLASERTESKYHLFFRGDGSVAAMGSDIFYGSLAGDIKDAYRTLNNAEIKQRVEAGVNQDYPGSVVSEVNVVEGSPRGQFEIRSEFSHATMAQLQSDGLQLSFPLPKTKLLENYGSLPARKTPVLVRVPTYDNNELTLMAPEGFQWDVKDLRVEEHSEFGSYELRMTRKSPKELVLIRETRLLPQMVQPDQYPAFQAFLKRIKEHEGFSLKAAKDDQL